MIKTKHALGVLILLYAIAWVATAVDWQWFYSTGQTYLHFLGGLFIAFLIASYYSSEFGKLSQPFRLFALIGIVMGVGVLWEFHEYILKFFAGQKATIAFGYDVTFIGDLADTMKDLLMDTLGGMTVAVLHLFRRGNG